LLHRSTANTTAVSTCCCHYHLLCSRLIVNSFFTLVWRGSRVCLSYAAVTALLSANLLIAAPQWPTPCCGQSTVATAVFLHAVPSIDHASQSSAISVAVRTLCALAVAAATALAVDIFIGFLLLSVSRTADRKLLKAVPNNAPCHSMALFAKRGRGMRIESVINTKVHTRSM